MIDKYDYGFNLETTEDEDEALAQQAEYEMTCEGRFPPVTDEEIERMADYLGVE